MQRCLELASNGLGHTYPNPMVGSVVVYDDTIIGEGWHQKAGEPHAEVLAIRSVKDASLLKKSTLYVNLEPCSHFGKTPPCADLITHHQIPRVVIGCKDPHDKVAGKGIEKLQKAGIEVVVGVLEQESLHLNRRFFTYHEKKRPYIILKWAESADGFIAPLKKTDRKPVWISNELSRQRVHQWRTEEQGILVGKNTVLEDNPKLNVRDWTGHAPVRITIDRNGEIPGNFEIKNGEQPTLIFTETPVKSDINQLDYITIDFSKNIWDDIFSTLYHYPIQSVIVEGGLHTLQSLIEVDLWDEARIFSAPVVIGEGIRAPKIPYSIGKISREQIEKDTLTYIHRHD